MDSVIPLWHFFCLLVFTASILGDFDKQDHRTEGARKHKNDLRCYRCDTMDDGERCSNLSVGNSSKFIHECSLERTICMVKVYSYTTSTENSTSVQRMWSLERNCTHRCEPGCIVIGERTKLYACTACCEKSLCNAQRGTAIQQSALRVLLFIAALFAAL